MEGFSFWLLPVTAGEHCCQVLVEHELLRDAGLEAGGILLRHLSRGQDSL